MQGSPTRPVRTRGAGVRWYVAAFATLLVAYVLVIVGVVHRSPLLTIDHDVLQWDLRGRWPHLFPAIHTYVMLGQRAPATMTALPWFIWTAWKQRSARPLVTLGTALFVLNGSVGVVKLATGRLGPLRTDHVHAVFAGGDIFPSGHTANAVVLYGVIAMLVSARYRKAAAVAAVFVSCTVGLSTVYLDTHWLSDVVGGWMAGGLVLMVLPVATPWVERMLPVAARAVRHGRQLPVGTSTSRRPGAVARAARPPAVDSASVDTAPADIPSLGPRSSVGSASVGSASVGSPSVDCPSVDSASADVARAAAPDAARRSRARRAGRAAQRPETAPPAAAPAASSTAGPMSARA